MSTPNTYSEAEIIGLIRSNIISVAAAFSTAEKPAVPVGYFALRSAADGRALLLVEIGDNPAEKFAGRCFNALEKGERIFDNPGTKSSWQTRDGVKKWGGAVRTPDFILSFSGLPEHADEALVVITAINMGWLDSSSAIHLLKISSNHIGLRLVTGDV